MDICEYPKCQEERVCFHFCRRHHEEICINKVMLPGTELKGDIMDAFDKLAQDIVEVFGEEDSVSSLDKATALLRARLGPVVAAIKSVGIIGVDMPWLTIGYGAMSFCPWCGETKHHLVDCPRQVALAAFENITPEKP